MSPDFEDFSTLILPILTTLLIGGIISLVYYILDFTRDRLKSYFTSSLTLSSSDPLYTWVYDYLIEKNLLVNSLSNVSCKTERKSKTFFWLNSTDVSADSEKPEMSFLPAVGYHAFIYQGVKINIFHESGRPLLTGFERKLVKIEEITLSCLGKGNVKILKSICEEAMNLAINKDKDCTNIYALNWSSWEKVQSKKPRPFHTVILDTNIAEEVIEDIRNFKQNQNWLYFILKI